MSMYGNRQQSFSFPMLSNEEILLCMNELQISIEQDDLEKPSARSVKPVYEALCEACIGVSKEEMNCIVEDEVTSQLEFPELHEDSIPNMAYFRAVCRLLSAAGVHDTRLWDVVKPDAKRFKRNMSAVINFAKFREERLQNFAELSNHTEELLEEKSKVEEENATIEGKLQEIQDERESEVPEIEKLEKECKALEAEINEKNKEQALLKYQSNNLKQSGNSLRDRLATLQFQKLNTAQETERIQSKIVQSPVRLKRELKEQQQELEIRQKENENIRQKLNSLQSRMAKLEKSEEDCTSALELLQEVEEHMLKCKAASKEIKNMSNSIKQHESMIGQYKTNKVELEKQIDIMKERLIRLKKQSSIKVEAAKAERNTASQELAELQAKHAQDLTEANENHEKKRQVDKKIEQQREQRNQVLQERTNSCSQLENAVRKASEALLQGLESN